MLRFYAEVDVITWFNPCF